MTDLIKRLRTVSDAFMKMAQEKRESDPGLSVKSFHISETCRCAAEELAKEKNAPAETEGDGRATWWYVCGECHTAIDTRDRYCRQCGTRIQWG